MLSGKTALITGATGGIGRAVAEELAARGCDLALNGLGEPDEIQALTHGLEHTHGVAVLYHGANLAHPGEVQAMLAAAADRFGGLDIVVNNAVVRDFAPVDQFSGEAWERALAVNLSSAFYIIRGALPHMRANGWGRIINMASVYAHVGVENRIGYVTTKTALLGVTRAVALETSRDDITCNAISPGTVRTPAIEARIEQMAADEGLDTEEATRRFLSTKQPSARFIQPESVARLVTFLCSDAGRDITGADLPVDGGWTAS